MRRSTHRPLRAGVLLFQLVTYKLPFDGETALAIVSKQLSDPLPRPTDLTTSLKGWASSS